MRPGWWEWSTAVRAQAPSQGAYTTAMVWASVCWNWRSSSATDSVRSTPMTADELAAAHPRPISQSTLQRRLKELLAAGLLERTRGHSRYGSNVYAPTFNTGHERPVFDSNTGHEQPLLTDNSGQELRLFVGNTGQNGSQHRSNPAGPPFSPEVPETPPRPDAHTHTREAVAVGGEVLDNLLRAMDRRYGETSSRVAPGYRRQAEVALTELRVAGWPADVLVDRINAREWGSAGSPGRVLMARINDLRHEPAPKTAAQRHAERQAEAVRTTCDHGDPKGCGGCFLCRRGSQDDDGVVCQQCHHGAGGNTHPTTHGGTA